MPSSAIAADAKRSHILGAARALLIKRGFQDIVLDDVAREAGVAKGTLFLYFKSKDELFSAAFADLVDQLGVSLDGLADSGQKGMPLLETTVRTVLEYFERNQDFMSLFGAGRFPGCGDRSCERLMAKFAANLERMGKVVRLCGVKTKDLEFASVALFGLCRSANIQRAIGRDPRPLAAKTAKVIDVFLHGIEGKA